MNVEVTRVAKGGRTNPASPSTAPILARAGLRTHRFTHRQVVREPGDVEDTLRALLVG